MPYKKITSGKNTGKYKVESGAWKGKVIPKAQMQAIEISKHAGQPGTTKPKAKATPKKTMPAKTMKTGMKKSGRGK
ncbi:hypothetical protein [Citrobacter farmeri]|uniref:hypothetical protein n=1 Tax=Citrobacter farmeri TaxID=67824 RepID=UPI0018FF94E2|nr:hypothetical protein [Citrobacter farmeri]MBJ9134424.1 hypothetical protein [Citrobacter farmeri]